MAYTSTYLNFQGQAKEAFNFYKSVFGGDFEGGIFRYGNMPESEMGPLPENAKNLVAHISLEILGGHKLMGSDVFEGMGNLIKGTNSYIALTPDSREKADELFAKLSVGGEIEMEMADMFWGDYFGSFKDKFGICWMIMMSSK